MAIEAMEIDRLWFDAVLHPHRALGPRGFLILMLAIAAVSFATGMVFVILGAWPVFGFFGLDVVLLWFAFRANFRSARQFERVRLTDRLLTIERVAANGRARSWQFEPSWARIDIDEELEEMAELAIASHGRRFVFARFLSPCERIDLARALRQAMAQRRANLTTAAP
ncbi:DUF2244 domain-containing protein [Oleomonas cavernae]|nr:DUF2244 domain-containing protein [Oleomonas cavernae]